MESRNPATGQPLGFDQLLTEAHGIVIAGSDTTRISMVTFLRHVYGRPEILAKLRAEIDRALEKGDFKMPPTYAQAAKLEYLQATMKEAMRIWPAVGMTLRPSPRTRFFEVDAGVLTLRGAKNAWSRPAEGSSPAPTFLPARSSACRPSTFTTTGAPTERTQVSSGRRGGSRATATSWRSTTSRSVSLFLVPVSPCTS